MRECDIFSRPGKRCGKVYCDERNVSQLLLKGCRNRSQTLNLHNLSEFTIGELKNIVHEKTGIDADEMLLNFGAKRLSDGRLSLDSYSLKSGSVIAMATRCHGGGGTGTSAERAYSSSHESTIQLTSESCSINHYDDFDVYRGVMSCGHAVDPGSLFSYGEHEIFKKTQVRFTCPAIEKWSECGAEWPYHEFRMMALLTPQECEMFETALAENSLFSVCNGSIDATSCYRCKSIVVRANDHISSDRMVCPLCPGNKSFCFACRRPWRGSENDVVCRRSDCQFASRFKILQSAPMKEIYAQQVPSLRSCPKCSSVIEHMDGCPHMVCHGCAYSFCFKCLKSHEGGDEHEACKISPRQNPHERFIYYDAVE